MTLHVSLVLGDEEPGVKCAVKNPRQSVHCLDAVPRIGETVIFEKINYEVVCVVHQLDYGRPHIYVYGVRR